MNRSPQGDDDLAVLGGLCTVRGGIYARRLEVSRASGKVTQMI